MMSPSIALRSSLRVSPLAPAPYLMDKVVLHRRLDGATALPPHPQQRAVDIRHTPCAVELLDTNVNGHERACIHG